MQSLKVIPGVTARIQDLQKYNHLNAEQILAEYKQNFKLFLQTFTQQVTQLIDTYESKIKQLTKQNEKLRHTLNFAEPVSPIEKFNHTNNQTSPSKFIESLHLDMMQTAKNNLFTSKYNHLRSEEFFFSLDPEQSKFKKENRFPIKLTNKYPACSQEIQATKSRFMSKSNIKKQKQSKLMNYLEAGIKNLQKTTSMFMSVIEKDQEEKEKLNENYFKQDRSESTKSIKLDLSNKKSLSKICESLEKSYHSRKSISQNMRKKELEEEEIKRKQKQNEEVSKMLKDRGVKNLLHRLRQNIENSTNQAEIIKNSRLISCGKGITNKHIQNVQSPSFSQKRSSKVMINPVPIDIGQKRRSTRNQSINSVISPKRKPSSILKNSKVLSRSLSGISAIQFI